MKGQQGGNEYLGRKVGFGFLTSPCTGEDVLGVRQFAHSDIHGACDVRRGDLCCLLRLNEARCGSHPRILTAQQTSGLDLILGDKRICLRQKKRCWGGWAVGGERSVSGFKSAERLGVGTESWEEIPMLEGSSRGPAAASAGIPVIRTMGRSPALGDTWWVCSHQDALPCGLAQHT